MYVYFRHIFIFSTIKERYLFEKQLVEQGLHKFPEDIPGFEKFHP